MVDDRHMTGTQDEKGKGGDERKHNFKRDQMKRLTNTIITLTHDVSVCDHVQQIK